MLHGDLKPANLLRSSDGLVKIADFGSALVYSEDEGMFEGAVNGTPAFRAPETLTAACKLTRKVRGPWVMGGGLLACMRLAPSLMQDSCATCGHANILTLLPTR